MEVKVLRSMVLCHIILSTFSFFPSHCSRHEASDIVINLSEYQKEKQIELGKKSRSHRYCPINNKGGKVCNGEKGKKKKKKGKKGQHEEGKQCKRVEKRRMMSGLVKNTEEREEENVLCKYFHKIFWHIPSH